MSLAHFSIRMSRHVPIRMQMLMHMFVQVHVNTCIHTFLCLCACLDMRRCTFPYTVWKALAEA